SGEMPIERRSNLQSALGGGWWIRTGDSPLCSRWNLCLLSLLLHIGEPAVVRRYHPAARRCFAVLSAL
ncbi:hypothetical protein HAX54_003657, partial [Datura stramonium]|nr:hypothetical protein [Datura stramonium]